jgi:flagellar hook-basal body protein
MTNYTTNITNGRLDGALTGFTIGGAAGTAGLTLTSTSVGATAAPTVTDTAPGTPVALASGVTGVAETQTVTFGHLAAGDSFTLAGRTFTATAFTSASNLRAAFDGTLTGSNLSAFGAFTGALTNFTIAAGTGTTAVLTSTVLGDVSNAAMTQGTLTTASTAPTVEETSPGTQRNINVQDLANTGTGIVTIAKTEGGVKTETSDVTFNDLVTGDSLTIGGLTLNATGTIPAATVASAFANLANGKSGNAVSNGYFTGSLAGYSTAGAAGNVVTFTSATASADVTDLQGITNTNVADLTNVGNGTLTIVKTEGGVKTEASDVTFRELLSGDSITIGGLTLTASGTIPAASVASAFANIANGRSGNPVANGTFSGTLLGFSTGASAGSAVKFTSAIVNSDVADLTINTNKVGKGSLGATYNLALSDGTNLSVKQISPSGVGEKKYKVETDRFAVYATLDGVPVGQTSTGTGMSSVRISGELINEQASLGTMAFVGGKNIDSLSRDQFGKPQFVSKISIDASGGAGATWGKTANGGTVQFTLDSTNMTGYSSAAQTYTNTQDGSATSQLTGYSFDSYGKLVAQYDNGKSVTKGQLILATFNNFEGLIPVGGNGFQESAASGAALIDKPNGSQMGAIRAQSLEESNVDLTQQLVKLMVLQRNYSAASQATKIQVATLIDDTLRIGT